MEKVRYERLIFSHDELLRLLGLKRCVLESVDIGAGGKVEFVVKVVSDE
jgi:hypothetical protein